MGQCQGRNSRAWWAQVEVEGEHEEEAGKAGIMIQREARGTSGAGPCSTNPTTKKGITLGHSDEEPLRGPEHVATRPAAMTRVGRACAGDLRVVQ